MMTEFRVVSVQPDPNHCPLMDPLKLNLSIESRDSQDLYASIDLVLDIAVVRFSSSSPFHYH